MRIVSTLLFVFGMFFFMTPVSLAGVLELTEHPSNPTGSTIKSDLQQYKLLRFKVTAGDDESVQLDQAGVRIVRLDNGGRQASFRDIHNCFLHQGSSSTPIKDFPAQLNGEGKLIFDINQTLAKNVSRDYSVYCEVPGDSNALLIRAEIHPSDIFGVGKESGFSIAVNGSPVLGNSMEVETGEPDLLITNVVTIPETVTVPDPDEYSLGDILTDEQFEDLKVEFRVTVKNQGDIDAFLKKGTQIAVHQTNFSNTIFTHELTIDRRIGPDSTVEFKFDVGPETGIRSRAGVQRMYVVVDQSGTVPESDETNNDYEFELEVFQFGELHMTDDSQLLSVVGTKEGDIKRNLARVKMVGFGTHAVEFTGFTLIVDGCRDSLANIIVEGGANSHNSRLIEPLEKLATNEHKFKITPTRVPTGAFYRMNIFADIVKTCETGPIKVGFKAIESQADVNVAEGLPLYGPLIKIAENVEFRAAQEAVNSPEGTEAGDNAETTQTPTDEDRKRLEQENAEPAEKENVTAQAKPVFAFGKPRGSLSTEQIKAVELKKLLNQHFGKDIPIHRDHWHIYVNSYVYGEYPVRAIIQGLRFGGKTVHPVIPWHLWKETKDYKDYINR